MNGNTTLILIIATLIVTTGGIVVFYDTTHSAQQTAAAIRSQQQQENIENGIGAQEFEVVNIVGTNVSSEGVKYVQIQVKYSGEGELNLNDTLIQLRTDKSITDLQYRNGTTNRSVIDGFYTQ